MQSAMTVGGVIGPLCGAIAAARLGFRWSFVAGGLVLLGCGALVRWGVPSGEAHSTARGAGACPTVAGGDPRVAPGAGWLHADLLPDLDPAPGDGRPRRGRRADPGDRRHHHLRLGAAAALGSLVAPRLAEVLPERRLVAALFVGSSLSVAALAVAPGVWSYGALRFLQVLFIAPVFPIVVARIAQTAGEEAIGVINAARIGASFIGPVMATSLLAAGSPVALTCSWLRSALPALPVSGMRAHVPAARR